VQTLVHVLIKSIVNITQQFARILRNLRTQQHLLLYVFSLTDRRSVRSKGPCFGHFDYFVRLGSVGGLGGMARVEGCDGVFEARLSEDGVFGKEVAFVRETVEGAEGSGFFLCEEAGEIAFLECEGLLALGKWYKGLVGVGENVQRVWRWYLF
jgi:hypothetical protein